MALIERLFPESPRPHVLLTPWGDLGLQWRSMDNNLRHMGHQMNDMLRQFEELVPIDRQREDWGVANPIVKEKDGSRQMQIKLDVRQFKPEEISLKTKDNVLHVHAKHEEKTENSHVFREYSRQFSLPEGVKVESMKSVLSPDGVLVVSAPLPAIEEAPQKEKSIPITHQ